MPNRLIPLLALLLVPTLVAADKDMARVITDVAKPVECIAPIEVYNLDGELVRKNPSGFDLEPGLHSMVGTAKIDAVNCPAMRGNQALDIPPLKYEFEAGKTYYVGLEHKSSNQQQWRFVVWREM